MSVDLKELKPFEHAADCGWVRCYPPIDGDEAANCNCGAVEENYIEWLKVNRPEALANEESEPS